jgi:hypothetical protein
MKLLLATSILITSLSLISFDISASNLKSIESLENAMNHSAKEIGITPKSYLIASQLLTRLDDPDEQVEHQLKRLDTFDEYHKILSFISSGQKVPEELQNKMITILNSQKSDLASYLHLDVQKLNAFLDAYSSRLDYAKNNFSTLSDDIDRITVTCTDACNMTSSWGYTGVVPYIWDKGYNTNFFGKTYKVSFKNIHTGKTFAMEEWKVYYNIARKVKDLPCNSCAEGDQ